MGCLVASGTKVEELLATVSTKTAKLEQARKDLLVYNGDLTDSQKPGDVRKLENEYKQSLEILKRISSLFPNLKLQLEDSVTRMDWNMPIIKKYITNKLSITQSLSEFTMELMKLYQSLKNLDVYKNNINNSTIQTLREMIKEAEYEDLESELEEVTKKEIELNTFRGGSLITLLQRIEARCNISKLLSIIQWKIEIKQYIKFIYDIGYRPDIIDQMTAELIDKKREVEEIYNLVFQKMEAKRLAEIQPLQDKIDEYKDKIKRIDSDMEKLNEIKSERDGKLEGISKMTSDLDLYASDINLLTAKVNQCKKQYEVCGTMSKKYKRNIQKIQTKEKELTKLNIQLKKAQDDFDKDDDEEDEKALLMNKNLIEIASLSQDLYRTVKKKQRQKVKKIKKQISVRLFNALRSSLSVWFWKFKVSRYVKNVPVKSTEGFDINEINASDLRNADKFITEQIEIALSKENTFSKLMDFQGIKPLESDKIFKFFEEIMDKKYEIDLKDTSAGVFPLDFPDFVYSYTQGIFGIPKSAERHLSRTLLALQQMVKDGHSYAIFISQLLQVFTKNPIFYDFGLYLVRARFDFQAAAYKYEKKLLSQGLKARTKVKQMESLEQGGFATLNNVVDLIIAMFQNHKPLGMLALQKIKPASMSSEEFITFLICQKVARMNKPIDLVFSTVDKNNSGTIDLYELSSFVRNFMDLWISEKDLEICFLHLGNPLTKEISRQVFCSTFSTEFFTKANDSEQYLVSKIRFFEMLLELQKHEYRKVVATYYSGLKFYPEALTKVDFSNYIFKVEPNIASEIEIMFSELCQPNGKIQQFDLIHYSIKKGIGNWTKTPFAMYDMLSGLKPRELPMQRGLLSYVSSETSRASLENSLSN